VNSNLATAIRTVVILIFAWSVALFTNTEPLSKIESRTWIFLVLSGVATGLSWLCYFRALQLGQASRVAPVDKLNVVIAIALAAVFLHEKLTWHHWRPADRQRRRRAGVCMIIWAQLGPPIPKARQRCSARGDEWLLPELR